MAREPGFAKVKPQLTAWWAAAKVTRQSEAIEDRAKYLYKRKELFYDPLEKATGVPWYMIAVIDERESGAKGGVLHNGEFIVGKGRKTKLVPAGRGPFKTWHEAALDALSMPGKNFDKVGRDRWSIELVLYCLESYNGWGYRFYHPETPSPYIWSCTNIYDNSPRGKYIADGKWGEGVTDQQIGCAPLLKALLALDKTAVVPTTVEPVMVTKTIPESKTIVTSVIGASAGIAAIVSATSDWKIMAVLCLTFILAAFGYIAYERYLKEDIIKGETI